MSRLSDRTRTDPVSGRVGSTVITRFSTTAVPLQVHIPNDPQFRGINVWLMESRCSLPAQFLCGTTASSGFPS